MVSTFNEIRGRTVNLRRFVDRKDKTWSAMNPSIGKSSDGKYALAIRSSNYVIQPSGELRVTTGGPIKSQVWFSDFDENFEITNLRKIDFSECGTKISRGVEDPKLLWRDGWEFTGVLLEKHTVVARNCHCYLDEKATQVTRVVKYDGVTANKPEKNWTTADKKPKNFDYIYGPYSVVKDRTVVSYLNDEKKTLGIRGNTHLRELGDGTYFAVVHRLYTRPFKMYDPNRFGVVDGLEKDYHHFFIRYDEYGRPIELSEPFQFISPGIEFAAGIVEMGDDYVISFGKNDASSHLAIIPIWRAMKMLKKI